MSSQRVEKGSNAVMTFYPLMYILSVSLSHPHTRTGSCAAVHLVIFCLVICFLMDVMNVCVCVCVCIRVRKRARGRVAKEDDH